jgi:hypothetical protein
MCLAPPHLADGQLIRAHVIEVKNGVEDSLYEDHVLRSRCNRNQGAEARILGKVAQYWVQGSVLKVKAKLRSTTPETNFKQRKLLTITSKIFKQAL